MLFRIAKIWDAQFETYRFEITDEEGRLNLLTPSDRDSDVVLLWSHMSRIAQLLATES